MQNNNERTLPAFRTTLLYITAGLFILISVCACFFVGKAFVENDGTLKDKLAAASDTADNQLGSELFLRDFCLEYSGLFTRLAGIRCTEGIVKLDNGQLTGPCSDYDMTPAAEAVSFLNAYCRENDTPFLYINLPHKPLSDEDLTSLGLQSSINHFQDVFLQKLTDEGIDWLDLRGPVLSCFADPYDCFYRTDHHWTPEAGLLAAGIITRELHSRYGLPVETDRLDPDRYETTSYKNVLLGEIGKKTGAVFAVPEDLLVIEPTFPTHLTLSIPSKDIDKTGDFSIFLDQNRLQNSSPHDTYLYYAYMYGNDSPQQLHNEDAEGGKVLIIKDSFSQVTTPYLAMGIRDLTCWDVRDNPASLLDHIKENDYDLVIVMYTGSMLKSPDRMFRFE